MTINHGDERSRNPFLQRGLQRMPSGRSSTSLDDDDDPLRDQRRDINVS